MNGLRVKIKQGVAAFLAVCLMMPSFAGTAWADIEIEEEILTEEHLVELDLDVLSEGIKDAVNQNRLWNATKMVFTSEDEDLVTMYEQLFQNPDGTNPVYSVSYEFAEDVLPAKSDLQIFVRKQALDVALFEDAEEMDEAEEDEEFLTASGSNAETNEEENEFPMASDSDAEDTTGVEDEIPTASDSDAINPEDGYQITGQEEVILLFKNSSNKNYMIQVTINGKQFRTLDVPTSSILLQELEQEVVPPVEVVPPTEVIPPAEIIPGETGVEQESTMESELVTEETTEESIEASIEESTEAATTEVLTTEAATAPETTAEETTAPETSAESEAATEAVEEETAAEPEKTDEVVVSFSEYHAPRVAVPVAGDIDEEDIEEDDTYAELEDIPFDEIEDSAGFGDEGYETYEGDEESEEIGLVYSPILYKEKKNSGFRSLLKTETTTASMTFTMKDVVGTMAADPFTVTLYNYNSDINTYSKDFIFSKKPNDMEGEQNHYQKIYKNKKYAPINITQGLVKPSYKGDGNFVNFSKGNLFPTEQGKIQSKYMDVYPNVQLNNFITKDEETGYYTFDSTEKKTTFKGNTLQGEDYSRGDKKGFYPFGSNKNFLGMHLSFDFSVLADGKVNNVPMIFEFQGDDDTWVYLTDKDGEIHKLALDIGGIHGLMGGEINFATGKITYEAETGATIGRRFTGEAFKTYCTGQGSDQIAPGSGWNVSPDNGAIAYLYTEEDAIAQYKEMHGGTDEKAKKEVNKEYSQFMGIERKELGDYTLDFYILERGGGESNCYLKFNIPTYSRDQVTVHKNVVSSDEDDKDKTYEFKLLTGTEEDNLEEAEVFSITPSSGSTSWTSKSYPTGTFFKIEETDDGGALKTKWKTGKGTTGSGKKTSSFVIGQENVVLFTNLFDMSPTVGKKAVVDVADAGRYRMDLEVEGETLIEKSEEKNDKDNNGDEVNYYLKNVIAHDELSQYVDFEKDQRNFPIFYQTVIIDGSEEEEQLKTEDGVTYTSEGNDAVVEVDGKHITWTVAGENAFLGKEDTKRLSFPVRVTSKAVYQEDVGNYPNAGDEETGSFAKQQGYYSNVAAQSYVTSGNTVSETSTHTMPFPKPVVRPGEPLKLVLEKKIENETARTKNGFSFKVTFTDAGDQVSAKPLGEDIEIEKVVDGNRAVFKVEGLNHEETVEFVNILPGASYEIRELNDEDVYYDSVCTGIATQDNYNGKDYDEVESSNPNFMVTSGDMTRVLSTDGEEKPRGWYYKTQDGKITHDSNYKGDAGTFWYKNGKLVEWTESQKFSASGQTGTYPQMNFYTIGRNSDGTYQSSILDDSSVVSLNYTIPQLMYAMLGISTKGDDRLQGKKVTDLGMLEEKLNGMEKGTTLMFHICRGRIYFGDEKNELLEVAARTIPVGMSDASIGSTAGHRLEDGFEDWNNVMSFETGTYTPIELGTGYEKRTYFRADGEETKTVAVNKHIAFTNKLSVKTTDIAIQKELGASDSEENTFVFRILNDDLSSPGYGQEFYASVTVPAGKTSATVKINGVPVSINYEASEEDHMRYELFKCVSFPKNEDTGNLDTSQKVDYNTVPTITFTNKKNASGYFSSTHTVINQVVVNHEGGFEIQQSYPGRGPTENPEITTPLDAMLPDNSSEKRGQNKENTDGDTIEE